MKHTSTKITDREIIQSWAEKRNGIPLRVTGVSKDTQERVGILRINFGEDEEIMEPTSWEYVFDIFDEGGFVFMYQDKIEDGDMSRFYKFISQETIEDRQE